MNGLNHEAHEQTDIHLLRLGSSRSFECDYKGASVIDSSHRERFHLVDPFNGQCRHGGLYWPRIGLKTIMALGQNTSNRLMHSQDPEVRANTASHVGPRANATDAFVQ